LAYHLPAKLELDTFFGIQIAPDNRGGAVTRKREEKDGTTENITT